MLRRSARLESTGYYTPDGDSTVLYKENLQRIFRKGRRCRVGSICCGTSSNGSFDSTWSSIMDDDDDWEAEEDHPYSHGSSGNLNNNLCSKENSCQIKMDRRSQSPSTFGRNIFGFILFAFVLCGVAYRLTIRPDSFQEPLPATNMEKETKFEEMAAQIKDLKDNLLKLKEDMNRRPLGNTLANFALYSLNARVLDDLSSDSYIPEENKFKIFGIPIWQQGKCSNCVLLGRSELLPGLCRAFQGQQGHLVIALCQPVKISHLSMGHIVRTLSLSQTITSAPKDFTVFGMENLEDEGTKIGSFFYDRDGDQLQTFRVSDDLNTAFRYVKLKIESNWGHPNYTCLYSFKVHGKQVE